jgi:thiamine biosynthesis protein ThiS
MNIYLNGEPRDVPENLSLAALLDYLKLPADRVAVERNREIAPKSTWNSTIVQAEDRLEVVHFVGGGTCDSLELTAQGRQHLLQAPVPSPPADQYESPLA